MRGQLLLSALEARLSAWQSSPLLCCASYHGTAEAATRGQIREASGTADRRQHEPFSIQSSSRMATSNVYQHDLIQDRRSKTQLSSSVCTLAGASSGTAADHQSSCTRSNSSDQLAHHSHHTASKSSWISAPFTSRITSSSSASIAHRPLSVSSASQLAHSLHTSPSLPSEPPLNPPTPSSTVTVPTGSLFEDDSDDDDDDSGAPRLIPPPPPEDESVGLSPAQQAAEDALRAEGQRMLREVRSIFTWCIRVEDAPEGAEVAAPRPNEAPLSDADVRRIIRFAVGSEMAKTQGGLELALGQADADEVKQLLEQLIQISDDGVISFKQLLEPDAPLRFLEAVLIMKLRLEHETAGGDPDAFGADGRDADADSPSAGASTAGPLSLDPEALRRAFAVLQSVDGVVSLQEIAATDRLFEAAAAVGTELSYELLLREDGPAHFIRAMLTVLMEPVSDEVKNRALDIMHAESIMQLTSQEMSNEIQDDQSSDSLLLFLTQHIDIIDACPPGKRDTLLRGLLDVYLLQRMPVVREFVPPAPGELPPEVAHSPMKPLGQEVSHRVSMLINLYPPQRVAWGAFVDLSKVVRPLRAKNHAKRLKYKDYKDIYYSED